MKQHRSVKRWLTALTFASGLEAGQRFGGNTDVLHVCGPEQQQSRVSETTLRTMFFSFLHLEMSLRHTEVKKSKQSHSCSHFHFCFSILTSAFAMHLNFMQKLQMQTPFIVNRPFRHLYETGRISLTFPEFHFPHVTAAHCCAMALFTVQPYNITIRGVSAAGGAPSLF